jgi:hypothetical protein
MSTSSLLSAPLWATMASGTRLELGAVVLVVILFAALLLVRAKQRRDQKMRKGASEGYYDPDVARFVRGPASSAPTEVAPDDADRALAPTFVAPVRHKAAKRGAPVPPPARPLTTAFGPGDPVPPRPVPAFDQAVAVSNRPVASPSPAPPATAPADPLPPPPPGVPSTVPAGAAARVSVAPLPPMAQPLPPVAPWDGDGPSSDGSRGPGR